MANMHINAKFTTRLSLEDIEQFSQYLENFKKQLPNKAKNIVQKVSEIGLQDNYKSVEVIPVTEQNGVIVGGIRTTDEKDTYREFGTGIVGSNSPHTEEFLEAIGWQYDVNQHGEKGWRYPKVDGTYGWTKGISAQKKFYEAMLRMEREFPNIAMQEFSK